MPFSIIQAGSQLQFMNTAGELTTLTLPSAVTLATDRPPRWIVNGRYVILVNTPSLPITIDGNGDVRLLAPRAPSLGAVLDNANGGHLTGTYFVRYTYVVTDGVGNLIAESDYSPVSNTFTVTDDYLRVSNLGISPDEITGRRVYRTTTDGAVLFQWIDLDGNVLTTVQDDLSDAGLSLFAAPTLGSPPYLTHIGEFRGRLFGVDGLRPDYLRFTEAGLRYSWPEDNFLLIQPEGSDTTGISALIPRRDQLGVGKLNTLWQVVGSGSIDNDGIVDFEPVRLSEQLGVVSQESVAVYRDTAYFLWYDGVYQWNSEGIRCISDGADGKGNVRTWFTKNDTFNRELFPNAFGIVDPVKLKYRLFLNDAETDEPRWIEYDLRERTWWGPHLSTGLTSISTFTVADPSETTALVTVIGTDEGNVHIDTDDAIDGENEPIHFKAVTKQHDADDHDYEKFFGEISIAGKQQDQGVLDVSVRVGDMDGTDTVVEYEYDMTKPRQRLGRIGVGKHAELTLENNEPFDKVEIQTYHINPINPVGRR